MGAAEQLDLGSARSVSSLGAEAEIGNVLCAPDVLHHHSPGSGAQQPVLVHTPV